VVGLEIPERLSRFGVDGAGAFNAVDAKTGKPLWDFKTNHSWRAGAMTYAIDGTQYIGVAAGSTILAFTLR